MAAEKDVLPNLQIWNYLDQFSRSGQILSFSPCSQKIHLFNSSGKGKPFSLGRTAVDPGNEGRVRPDETFVIEKV